MPLPALLPDTADLVLRHRNDDPARLMLRLAGREDAAWIVQQVEGWQRLRTKVPRWAATEGIYYPVRLSTEQCSGEEAARYKAALARRVLPGGGTMADLTGGMGVDFSFLAEGFAQCTYIERSEALCALAAHNFPLLGLGLAAVVCGDAEEELARMDKVDLLMIDPARRDGVGRKTVRLADCTPDVVRLHPLLRAKSRYTLVKLSPMLDITEALRDLPAVEEVHVVAVGGECKELLLLLGDGGGNPVIHCVDGNRQFSFRPEEETDAVAPVAETLGTYLYEPSPAVLKGGAFRCLCARYGVEKLHRNTHLYTSEQFVADFPGRIFRIEEAVGFGKKELRPLAGRKANLATRNFPQDVATLKKKLKISDGGDIFLFAVTMKGEERKLIKTAKIK